MTNRIIVFEYTGIEHFYPVPREANPETIDFSIKKTYDISLDGDGSHWSNLPRYEKRSVDLPDWLTTEEFCQGWYDSLRYLIAFGASLDWPEAWLRGLKQMETAQQRYGAIQLLKANAERMRSAVRKSIREQIIVWLTTEPSTRVYTMPMSPRQCEIAMGPYGALTMEKIRTCVYRWPKEWGEEVPHVNTESEALISNVAT